MKSTAATVDVDAQLSSSIIPTVTENKKRIQSTIRQKQLNNRKIK